MADKSNRLVRKMFEGSLSVIIIMSITTTLGMLVDGIFIGNFLGVDAMAAYGIVSPMFVIYAAVGGIFSSGCQTLVARALSSGKLNKANGIFTMSCILGIIVSVVIMIVVIAISTPLTSVLGASGDTAYLMDDARGFLTGLTLGVPGIIMTSCLQCVMQLDNDGKRAIMATAVMTAIIIIGDSFVIFVLEGGLLQMAMMTALAYYASTIVLLFHFRKKDAAIRFDRKNVEWSEAGRMFSTGLPTAVSRICTTLRTLVLNHLLLIIAGSLAVAAFSVQSNMNNLFGSVGPGIGMAVLLISGITVGEENKSMTKGLLKTALSEGFIIVTIIAAFVFVAAPLLVALYINDPATTDMAISCVRWFALSMPVHAVNTVFINYLQGSRNLALSHAVCILNEFVMVVAFAFILGSMFGVDGVWASFLVGRLITLLCIVVLAAWRSRRVPRRLDDYLFLPKDFDVPDDCKLEASAEDMDQVLDMSMKAQEFCREKGIDQKRGYYVSLCIEEMAGNIIRHGFTDDKKHSIQLRLIYKDGELVLRIRDDCAPFDPKKWMEIHEPVDKTANIGIRLTYKIAGSVQYINTMKMNNLIIRV